MVTQMSTHSGPALLFDRYCCEILSRGKQWQRESFQPASQPPWSRRGIDWRLRSRLPHLAQRTADTRVVWTRFQMSNQGLKHRVTV